MARSGFKSQNSAKNNKIIRHENNDIKCRSRYR